MKIKNLKALALAAILPSAMMLSAPAEAVFIIDDFNTATTRTVTDSAPAGGGPVSATTIIDGANIVANNLGWSRTISANLTAGDNISTEVCFFCQAGHLVSGAGGGVGISTFDYAGSDVNLVTLNADKYVMFDYAADKDGAVVTFTFSNGVSVVSPVLANTNASSNPANLKPVSIALGAGDFSNITGVRIDVQGVPDLDFTIDNVKTTVPEPESIALLGIGLVAMAFRRRRSVTAISA